MESRFQVRIMFPLSFRTTIHCTGWYKYSCKANRYTDFKNTLYRNSTKLAKNEMRLPFYCYILWTKPGYYVCVVKAWRKKKHWLRVYLHMALKFIPNYIRLHCHILPILFLFYFILLYCMVFVICWETTCITYVYTSSISLYARLLDECICYHCAGYSTRCMAFSATKTTSCCCSRYLFFQKKCS